MQFITIYWWRIIACALISYLLGSFSFAVIFTKLSSKKDVREMGSGNAGFTNVLRSVGVVPEIFTFVFDCLKGIISVLITMWIFNMDFDSTAINALSESLRFEFNAYGKYLAGVFCVLGHSFPVFFGFRGGKGITTMAGILLILYLALLSALAYSLWGLLLKYNPMSKVAVYGFATPVLGVFLSILLLNEGGQALSFQNIIALVCVSIGVLIVNVVKKGDV